MQGNPPKTTEPGDSLHRHGSETYDTEHRDAPICPYCGYARRDAWEINFGPGIEGQAEITCGRCEEDFAVQRNCTVTYSTDKIPNAQAEPRPGE